MPYSSEVMKYLEAIYSQRPDRGRRGERVESPRQFGDTFPTVPYGKAFRQGSGILEEAVLDPEMWRNRGTLLFTNKDVHERWLKAKRKVAAEGLLSDYIKDTGYEK